MKKETKCKYCIDIDELDGEYHGAIHEGQIRYCGECEADYYEEYEGKTWASNKQAKINHPELDLL